jgi:hypothetical protein
MGPGPAASQLTGPRKLIQALARRTPSVRFAVPAETEADASPLDAPNIEADREAGQGLEAQGLVTHA